MDAPHRTAVVVLTVAWLASPLAAQSLPLAVQDGRTTAVLPTSSASARYLLIVGCVARSGGPYRVRVTAGPTDEAESLPVVAPTADAAWEQRTREVRERLDRARRTRPPSPAYPLHAPPKRKSFHLFAGGHDFADPASYVTFEANLHTVGEHCQVFVDGDQPESPRLREAVADAVRTFDAEVYPRATRDLGRALDVDRDGRFTIVLTPRLAKLSTGKAPLRGFVRGSDFYRDLPAPFGNACDMMWLDANLSAGPHLRTLLAHEHTHAVVFSEHVFGDYPPGGTPRDEESWLNEGLAHLVEEAHGYSWSNLDHRIAAFLDAPEASPLVVPDAYAAGLWRDPGHRGAAFLFLRHCARRHGPDLARRLTQSGLCGVANVEAATQTPFADLFRSWCVGLTEDPFVRGRVGEHRLAGPRTHELCLAGGARELSIQATAAAYLVLHSPAGARVRVTVTAPAEAELQVTLVRVPAKPEAPR